MFEANDEAAGPAASEPGAPARGGAAGHPTPALGHEPLDTVLERRGVTAAHLVVDGRGTLGRQVEEVLETVPDGRVGSLVDLQADARARVELGPVVARGGMGVVHVATQPALKRQVAVKVLRDDVADDVAISRLLREAWVSGNLEHPNILPIHDLVPGDGSPMLVMKRIEGVSWSERLHETRPRGAGAVREDLEAQLQVLIRVCHAVHFAHSRGVLHLDLKPDNVMLGEFGEVYLLDWGLAVSVLDDRPPWMDHAAGIRTVCGTPAYVAPELASARGDLVGVHTDVYLLGAVLHEVLIGRPPHEAKAVMVSLSRAYESVPATYPEDVPRELAAICNRAMAREPRERFPSAEAFRVALEQYLGHRSSTTLSARALRRLEQLRSSLDKVPPEEERRLFTECRFALQQALEIWPESPAAADGLQALLELEAERALRLGEVQRAAGALRELRTPVPHLESELENLERRLASEAAEVQALKALERDVDLRVNSGHRVVLALGVAVLWMVWNGTAGVLRRARVLDYDYPEVFASTGVTLVLYALAVWWFRHTLLATRINRRVLALFGGGFATTAAFSVATWIAGVPPLTAVALNPILYLFFIMALAFSVDLRALWAALPVLPAVVLAPAYVRHAFEINGVAGSLAALIIAGIWYADGRRAGGDGRGRA